MSTPVAAVAIDREKVRSSDSESFPVPHDRGASGALGSGSVARLLARARAGSLDRALIAGADPTGSRQLAARVARLTAPRTRALIAEGLDRLVQAARGPQRRWWAVGQRHPLLANAEDLHELAALLRGGTPLHARGIAILSEALSDGTGPAYHGDATAVARWLHDARAAMAR
jgi:hypothetical protein